MSGFGGYRTEEQRQAYMLRAAMEKDPTIYGDMDEGEKAEYERMVKFVESVPEGATIDVPYNMD